MLDLASTTDGEGWKGGIKKMRSYFPVGVLGLAIALVLSSAALAQTSPQKDLTVVSWGGSYTRSQMLAYVKPFRRQSGEWVTMETYNGGLEEIRIRTIPEIGLEQEREVVEGAEQGTALGRGDHRRACLGDLGHDG